MSEKQGGRSDGVRRVATKLAQELNQELREGKSPDEIEDPLIRSFAEDHLEAGIDPETVRLHPTAIENMQDPLNGTENETPPKLEAGFNPIKKMSRLAGFVIRQVHKSLR